MLKQHEVYEIKYNSIKWYSRVFSNIQTKSYQLILMDYFFFNFLLFKFLVI
jgi:hypothetical protein